MNNYLARYLCIPLLLTITLFTYTPLSAQHSPTPIWVDSLLTNMSLEAKLGQLFVIQTDIKSETSLHRLIETIQPAGVLIKGASLYKNITTQNTLQDLSQIPLLQLSDQSVSITNQIDDYQDMPSNAALSCVEEESVKQQIFQQFLIDQTTLGINCSFAPNITLPNLHAYTSLSNEQDFEKVQQRTLQQVTQLNHHKILSIIRGVQLPTVQERNSSKTAAYKELTKAGLSGVFIEESNFDLANDASILAPNFFRNYLKNSLQFDGISIGTISEKVSFLDLFYAGADLCIIKEQEMAEVLQQVKHLVQKKHISISEIDQRVTRLLKAKFWLGLDFKSPEKLSFKTVSRKLYKPSQQYLTSLYEQSIVLGNDIKQILPLDATYGKNNWIIQVGPKKLSTLQRSIFKYINCGYKVHTIEASGDIPPINTTTKGGLFLIALDQQNLSAEKDAAFLQSLDQLNKENNLVVINFGNPANLSVINDSITSVQVFDQNSTTERIVTQLLFGSTQVKGRMPLAISESLPYLHQQTQAITRLKYASPSQVDMDLIALDKIEEIVQQGIDQQAMPGCQVLVARKGQIVYSKSFGYHTYDKQQRVELSDLYDVASITKVAATTLAVMKLHGEEIISIEKPLGNQMALPSYSTIKTIPLKKLLIHQSGLQRNMPIGKYLSNKLGNTSQCSGYYCAEKSTAFSQRITEGLYMNPITEKAIWKDVNQLVRPKKYLYRSFMYGDVNFYILQQLIEQISGKDLDKYVADAFYKPLGLRYCLFNPLARLPKTMITPTQLDDKWRMTQLRGDVHDETAALHGGVAGNAGLFSNAEDLAVLFQMLLNGGEYGGKRYLNKATIDLFTNAGHGNHRGLGFDKPGRNYTVSSAASPASFGHAGFSGTCVWVDPDKELIYIFLANRIYPDRNNSKMMKMNIRRKIHQVIYDAIQVSPLEEDLFVNIGEE